jgi:Ca-activated chloride channel family protein
MSVRALVALAMTVVCALFAPVVGRGFSSGDDSPAVGRGFSPGVLAGTEGPAYMQAAPQFRTSSELVPVYATVQDASGRLVPDLKQDDFVVLDNGREQRITFFSSAPAPISVVVMLDRSISMKAHDDAIVEAGTAFVRALQPDDQARIGSIGLRVRIEPPKFTADHHALLEALRASPTDGPQSPVWESVDQSITALYGIPGRRVVLLMTDGRNDTGDPRAADFKDVYDRLQRSGVMLYAIGFGETRVADGRSVIDSPDPGLKRLADVSGGGYFEMTDAADMTRLFTRVAEELRQQYWLGFEPARRDGKLHDIRVRVKRPGLTARARQTYLAPAK